MYTYTYCIFYTYIYTYKRHSANNTNQQKAKINKYINTHTFTHTHTTSCFQLLYSPVFALCLISTQAQTPRVCHLTSFLGSDKTYLDLSPFSRTVTLCTSRRAFTPEIHVICTSAEQHSTKHCQIFLFSGNTYKPYTTLERKRSENNWSHAEDRFRITDQELHPNKKSLPKRKSWAYQQVCHQNQVLKPNPETSKMSWRNWYFSISECCFLKLAVVPQFQLSSLPQDKLKRH